MTSWLVSAGRVAPARSRLFCFPYAGGAASVFRPWAKWLCSDIELCIIQYPGREDRFGESLHEHVQTLLPPLAEAIGDRFDRPYGLFGHSMGAGIAYHLTRLAARNGWRMPERLFVSGARAPHRHRPPIVTDLDDDAFVRHVRERGGTPESVLNNVELMALLLPRLRADFRLAESLALTEPDPIECPITVLAGEADVEVSQASARAWDACTTADLDWRGYSGDHFFLHEHAESIVADINRLLWSES
ncbi:MAG: thioesterase domain-containing protein [Pseudomonadota bacterium]